MTTLTKRRARIVGMACLFGFCATAQGCSGSNEAPAAAGPAPGRESTAVASPSPAGGQGVSIQFRSEPDPPTSGDNTFEVVVAEPNGSPVTDATVDAVFSMPAMPSMNMPAMRSTAALPHQGSGRYRGGGQLAMSGTWTVIVTASRGAEEIGRRTLSVVAK